MLDLDFYDSFPSELFGEYSLSRLKLDFELDGFLMDYCGLSLRPVDILL